jgi:hypothetical protein
LAPLHNVVHWKPKPCTLLQHLKLQASKRQKEYCRAKQTVTDKQKWQKSPGEEQQALCTVFLHLPDAYRGQEMHERKRALCLAAKTASVTKQFNKASAFEKAQIPY